MNISGESNTSSLGYQYCYYNSTYSFQCPTYCCYSSSYPYSPYCCGSTSANLWWLWVLIALVSTSLFAVIVVCIIQRIKKQRQASVVGNFGPVGGIYKPVGGQPYYKPANYAPGNNYNGQQNYHPPNLVQNHYPNHMNYQAQVYQANNIPSNQQPIMIVERPTNEHKVLIIQ